MPADETLDGAVSRLADKLIGAPNWRPNQPHKRRRLAGDKISQIQSGRHERGVRGGSDHSHHKPADVQFPSPVKRTLDKHRIINERLGTVRFQGSLAMTQDTQRMGSLGEGTGEPRVARTLLTHSLTHSVSPVQLD